MDYIMIRDRKEKNFKATKREVVGIASDKDLDKKVEMTKRLFPGDKISVFKEIKLSDKTGKWK